jgi:hypothetical protein
MKYNLAALAVFVCTALQVSAVPVVGGDIGKREPEADPDAHGFPQWSECYMTDH